jgi:hypothetical protein
MKDILKSQTEGRRIGILRSDMARRERRNTTEGGDAEHLPGAPWGFYGCGRFVHVMNLEGYCHDTGCGRPIGEWAWMTDHLNLVVEDRQLSHERQTARQIFANGTDQPLADLPS